VRVDENGLHRRGQDDWDSVVLDGERAVVSAIFAVFLTALIVWGVWSWAAAVGADDPELDTGGRVKVCEPGGVECRYVDEDDLPGSR
jgi:hypothetical protein